MCPRKVSVVVRLWLYSRRIFNLLCATSGSFSPLGEKLMSRGCVSRFRGSGDDRKFSGGIAELVDASGVTISELHSARTRKFVT